MVRWQPGARERLQEAALELFATQGFEQTTAAEIAQSVGLTERTFFRHFSDKREVLFDGQSIFLDAFLEGIEAAPPHASALQLVAAALDAAGAFFVNERRPHSRMRYSVIAQNPALQERELHKFFVLASAVAEALRARGVAEPLATLAAESGATMFGIAFAQWIREGEERTLAVIGRQVLREFQSLTAESIEPARSSQDASRSRG
ncbi:TetR/AcrR family transcriptional regulator [Leifsonia sp. Root112D2]|jgi:AcrR family transcriptional regulator|uniref:TetR/AcrR family transcriptional regulator n=1 Tax=Leifsonia sp. Root112D2 TaxID=1736426 RepID=UPI0006F90B45|nr:TetR/AcrR family transcriptional regulator [Leifsonia sp. Root112D2]KQV07443.1 TetR family transcriptional regulator [Leifsonia sp. Root112D2]